MFPLPWWAKDLPVENLQVAGGQLRIHLCSSGVISDLGECFFWGLCKPVIASTDPWPQDLEMFTFLKCLQWPYLKAVSVPTFVIGGLRRSTAHSGMLLSKTIGNRKGDCAWSCSRWKTQPETICKLQCTNQFKVRSTDLCVAICRFSQVVLVTSNNFTHNLPFYFQ